MRKYILLLCTLFVGLTSCVKEDFAGVDTDGLVTFKASYETETKTVLNGLTPYWTPSEKICIYNGAIGEFTATVTEPSATATFKGELAGKGTKNFRAVTPYSDSYTFSSLGSTFYGLSVPQEQTAVENSYDPNALVAIALSDDYNLSFKNLGSLVKFTILSEGVTSVTLRSNNEEVLSGSFEASYESTPSIRVREGKDEVTIRGDFKKDSTYYIVTLPSNLEKGLIVLLNDSVKSMSVEAPVVLARSAMVSLGGLSLNPAESQLPDNGDEDEDEGVASDWIIIGSFCDWSEEGALATYDLGGFYKAFDVPAAALSSFKFRSGDVWLGLAGDAAVADTWVALSSDGGASDITFTGSAEAYDVYLDNGLSAFYVTAAGNPAPEPIPAPFTGKSVAGNFNTWDNTANPMTEEADYYVAKGLQLASTNIADPTSNGFKFVDVKGGGDAVWYGVGVSSIELGQWYNTQVDGSVNICINGGESSALYDAYITKDMSTFCVVAAGAQLPSKDNIGGGSDNIETQGTIYLQPNSNWLEADARFAAYFWQSGKSEVWVDLVKDANESLYKCDVPVGYTNVIFTRMNPASSANSWDNKWNQTADLVVPTDDKVCYVITPNTWDNDGYWTVYPTADPTPDPTPEPDPDPTPEPDPDPTPEPDPDPTPEPDPTPDPGTGDGEETEPEQVRIYLSTAWGWPYIWCWDSNGAQIFAGASWPGTKYHGEENGYYYWNVPEAYIGQTVNLLAVKEDQSEQTSDYNGVVLDKSVYFYLEWTSELGCHLIQENK
ncbi:MAG: hypothetical protein IKZ08_04685 [Bacteroidales bacterium]|nr:hypothetical protein [Bacteroidales bacterium]